MNLLFDNDWLRRHIEGDRDLPCEAGTFGLEMHMIIRSKLSVGSVERGHRGAQLWCNAVYEGSAELQRISENAIFGDATPNGQLNMTGDFEIAQFEPVPIPGTEWKEPREIYVDLMPQGEPVGGDFIVRVPVHKAFQSAVGQYAHAAQLVNFRYVSDGQINAQLTLGVHNPPAIQTLDELDHAMMVVRICDGRRSAAEIVVLEQLVARDEAQARTNGMPSYYEAQGWDIERWVAHASSSNRRRLARAKGEA